MKVLIVIHPPVFGGLHNMAAELHRPLLARGIETSVMMPESDARSRRAFERVGMRVFNVPLHRVRRSLSPATQVEFVRSLQHDIRDITNVVRTEQIDVVQSHGVLNLHAVFAGRRAGVARVLELNSSNAPLPARLSAFPVSRLVQAVGVEGQGVLTSFPGLRFAGTKVFKFLPPVDVSSIKPDPALRREVRDYLGIDDTEFLIGTIGNFTRQKGHDRFVRAAAAVLNSVPNARFVVIGQPVDTNAGFFQERVRDFVNSDSRLAAKLAFLTTSEPAARFLPAMDCYAVSSRAEGVATATLEAMSAGLPVAAFNVGSLSDVIHDGVNGHLVRSGDVEGLSRALVMLASDRSVLGRMSTKSRRLALEQFTVEASAAVHERAYRTARAAFDAAGTRGR